MSDQELRKLASWYRQFAERTGNPTIWEMRLRMAEKLEAEAKCVDNTRFREPRSEGFAAKTTPDLLNGC
jgi:hypothetical protein